jgi:glycyl-tRNA synthetase beta chain
VTRATLLVELLTEELPPKALARLANEFSDQIHSGLQARSLVADDAIAGFRATPRRLAALITNVASAATDSSKEVDGPPVSAKPEAVAGFARKQGVDPSALQQRDGPKGKIYFARVEVKGARLDVVLAEIVADAVKRLPIPKVMRWGAGDAQFVRPVHGLVMLHGKDEVPGEVLGLKSGRSTKGHRFMGKADIRLANAGEYEAKLRDEGRVVVDFAARRTLIEKALREKAKEQKAGLGEIDSLLDEVTALVEYPSVYVGEFERKYLEIPAECLVLTMRQNQKYFPLFDAAGKLTGKFLIVSNMQVADAKNIVGGNERVVRPRLGDARFFYDQDRKQKLEERVPLLEKVVYHAKLGSQLERVKRVQALAGKIAGELKEDAAKAKRAAWLCKADLLSGMVGEFPELQGVMGRYYALHDKEAADVAEAIESHYRPRFAGDKLPEGGVACAVALADKLDALAGLFSIGQQPTGDKDPFGLRRAALGVVRILVEHRLGLSLHELADAAFEPFKKHAPAELQTFLYERFGSYLKELGYSTLQIDSVLGSLPANLGVVPQQLEAVRAFQALPEAESLAAANKRVANILKQAEAKGERIASASASDLREPAEKALLEAIQKASATAKALYEKGDYAGYLKSFAVLKAPVDTFFDKVMVMVEDDKLRRGRLALLRDLREAMNRVADISKLAT